MRLRSVWVSALGFALAAAVACGGGGESQSTSSTSAEPSAPSATPAGQRVDTANAGSIKGVVSLEGEAPKNQPIKMNADPVCVKQNPEAQMSETYAVTDGKIANVFVYVKDGLGNYVYDTLAILPSVT